MAQPVSAVTDKTKVKHACQLIALDRHISFSYMREIGSEIFGTDNIKTEEYLIAAKVLRDDKMKPEEILITLSAWDDILGLIRMQMIIVGASYTSKGRKRKDADLQSLINNRVDIMIDQLREIGNN